MTCYPSPHFCLGEELRIIVQHQIGVINDRDSTIDSLNARIRALTFKCYEEEFRANFLEDDLLTLQQKMTEITGENQRLRAENIELREFLPANVDEEDDLEGFPDGDEEESSDANDEEEEDVVGGENNSQFRENPFYEDLDEDSDMSEAKKDETDAVVDDEEAVDIDDLLLTSDDDDDDDAIKAEFPVATDESRAGTGSSALSTPVVPSPPGPSLVFMESDFFSQ